MNNAAVDDDTKDPWKRFGWLMAVGWMVFLVFPALQLVHSTAPAAWVVVGWVGIAVFAVAYVYGFVTGMRHGWGRLPLSTIVVFPLLLVCAAATVPAIEWWALGFLPFIMSFASYGMGWRWHWIVNSAAVALVVGAFLFSESGANLIWLLVITVVLAAVNSANVWLIGRSVRADQLRLDLATSHEREAISRDVHDLIGHSLTVVKLKAELAAKLVDRDPERAKQELQQITALTGEAIANVRATVTGLRASTLDEQLAASCSAVETAGLEFFVEGSPEALSAAQSLTASWVLREATTNILRHAQASRVSIELRSGTLRVTDDGVGMPSTGAVGNGMRSMAERASAAGATLAVEPGQKAGTRVTLQW